MSGQEEPEILPSRKLSAVVSGTYVAASGHFETAAVESLTLGLRGLVAWVEKPGRIGHDEEIMVRIPEQWIYRA